MQILLIGKAANDLAPALRARGHEVELMSELPPTGVAADLVFTTYDDPVQLRTLRCAVGDATLVSVIASDADADKVLDAGVDDVLRMPLSRPDMIDRICVAERLAAVHRHARQQAHGRGEVDPLLSRIGYEWRTTLDSVPLAVIMLDPNVRITRLNEAARAMLDRSFDAIVGVDLESFAAWEPWAAAHAMALRIRGGEDHIRHETSNEATDRMWELSAGATGTPGRDCRIILTVRDITEEVKLRHAAEVNERLAAMGSLLSGVAHEVRNPLFGISAIADALEARFQANADYVPHLGMLRKVVSRLSTLMADLLELGSAGKLDRADAELVGVVNDARAACAHLSREREVEVVVNDLTGGRNVVHVDRARVFQVFQNVIDNAIRHSPPNARVEVILTAHEHDRTVRCEVRDHGPGFGADRRRALEPFFSRRTGGTGLGLSIVRNVVERHAGQIALSDHPGGGAVVRVTLPRGHGPA